MAQGLFEKWLDIEKSSGRPFGEVLADLNRVCGTKYKHNWPSVMAARSYSLDRLPTGVRQYLMARVLPVELASRGMKLRSGEILDLVFNLT